MPSTQYNEGEQFSKDILQGLSGKNKWISSKYFYDTEGSTLFTKISKHPDYYLTGCEIDILETNKKRISELLGEEGSFNLIDLGPGDGTKTKILMEQFLKDCLQFTYYVIDISEKYIEKITKKIQKLVPELRIKSVNREFLLGMQEIIREVEGKNMLLFLGSSIGNLDRTDALQFLHTIGAIMHEGDYLLLGFDLRKDLHVLFQAYDDRDHLTKQFNLNLLDRINRELGADFDLDFFDFYVSYDHDLDAIESFLVSTKNQDIYIEKFQKTVHFEENEPIHTEYSHKYSLSQINDFAVKAGFQIVDNFMDEKGYFLNSLWQVR